ncbi:hypothetical protein [Campylobacter sp. MG1]|uniref:hypothetical protein n=1 Tax=Campylobacter sp. MG1 TaxID=2976332 RepID=UPI00226D29D6|nr:hypothetical protein [Campylobacter sp. MG1]
MGIDVLIYLVFIVFVIFIFIYVRVSNKDLDDRLNGVLKAVDSNLKDMHEIKEKLEILKEIQLEQNRQVSLYVKQSYEPLIHNIIDERMHKINDILRAIQENIKESRKTHDNRVENSETIESKNNLDDDRKQIVQLFSEGKSVDEISSMLNKSPQAINLILRSL